MNKNDLITQIAQASNLTKTQVNNVLDHFVETVSGSLKKKEEVRIPRFGTFTTTERQATTGRNPRTGQPIKIPAKCVPRFRPGKELREAVGA